MPLFLIIQNKYFINILFFKMENKKTCKNCQKQGIELKICTHCREVYYCSIECQKSDWKTHKNTSLNIKSEQKLTISQFNHIIQLLQNQFINVYRIIYSLDPAESDRFKNKNTYYYQKYIQNHNHKHNHPHQHSCCSKFNNKIYIPQNLLDGLEKIVYEVIKKSSVSDSLYEFLNYAADTFFNIRDSGIDKGQKLNQVSEKYILNQVLINGTTKFFTKKIKQLAIQNQRVQSKQPMLYANATTWYSKYPNVKLDFLESNVLKKLNQYGWTIDKNFISYLKENLRKQIQFYQKDGQLDQVLSESLIRNDRVKWIDDINQKQNPYLFQAMTKLYSIPFELNTKTKFNCLISQTIQISYFKFGGKHKKHMDSTFLNDSGKKFTIIYAFNKIVIDLYKINQEVAKEQIILEKGQLIIFKSRIFSYQIKCTQQSTFLIRYWINGPIQQDN